MTFRDLKAHPPSARRIVPRARAGCLLGMATLLAACTLSQVDLAGKDCPCAVGWVCDERTQSCVAVDAILGPDHERRDARPEPERQSEAGESDLYAGPPPSDMATPEAEIDAGAQAPGEEPDGGGADTSGEPSAGSEPMTEPPGCDDPTATTCDGSCPSCAFSSPTEDISLPKACWAPGEFMPVTIHMPRAASDWLWVQNHPDYGGKDEEFWDRTGILTPDLVYRGGEREPGGLHAPSEPGTYRITWHPWDAWDEYVHSALDFTVSGSCP